MKQLIFKSTVFTVFLFFSLSSFANDKYTKLDNLGDVLPDDAGAWWCVRNNTTGQVWEKKNVANETGWDYSIAVFNAPGQFNSDQKCGMTGWRLPSIKELYSIQEDDLNDPAIDQDYFSRTIYSLDTAYWSSTAQPYPADVANPIDNYVVKFIDGEITVKDNSTGNPQHVRLVTGGQYFDHFDYTKLDDRGSELPNSASVWSCVRDNHSGLIWQVKTSANKDQTYAKTDLQTYTQQLNNQRLCGLDDWQIPAANELISLVNYSQSQPAISTDFFPNTSDIYYSSSLFENPTTGIYDQPKIVNFDQGFTQKLLVNQAKLRGVHQAYSKISKVGVILDVTAETWACVRNNKTGQLWEVKSIANSQSTYPISNVNSVANKRNAQNLCGRSDWHVPSIKELFSLSSTAQFKPSLDKVYFPYTKYSDVESEKIVYWSTDIASSNQLIFIDFFNGTMKKHNATSLSAAYMRVVSGTSYFDDNFDLFKLDANAEALPALAKNFSCVRDGNTNLVWETKTTANKAQTYTMAGALAFIEQVNNEALCGYNNWRMPDIYELLSIVDFSQYKPSVNESYFPNTQYYRYASTTVSPSNQNGLWQIEFYTGLAYYSENAFYLRLVRSDEVNTSVLLTPILYLLF